MKIRMGCVGHIDSKQLPKFRRIFIIVDTRWSQLTTHSSDATRNAEIFTVLTARRLPLFHQTSRRAVSPLFATVRLALLGSASAWEGIHLPGHCAGAAPKPCTVISINLTAQLPTVEEL